ncbi:MAG: GntR family transcriptional regulator, partial [Proteobacteria bacterium]
MSPTTSETSRQKAYVFIQRKLLEGEIRAGDLVSELALAAEIGMSRTPIREAIGQLELEGLFDKVPRVGTLVRLPDQRELRELYEVREALESHAASVATSVLD